MMEGVSKVTNSPAKVFIPVKEPGTWQYCNQITEWENSPLVLAPATSNSDEDDFWDTIYAVKLIGCWAEGIQTIAVNIWSLLNT